MRQLAAAKKSVHQNRPDFQVQTGGTCAELTGQLWARSRAKRVTSMFRADRTESASRSEFRPPVRFARNARVHRVAEQPTPTRSPRRATPEKSPINRNR